MPAKVYSLKTLDDVNRRKNSYFFLDTSFLLSALAGKGAVARECNECLKTLAEDARNSVLGLFIDELVINEMLFILMKRYVKDKDWNIAPFNTHIPQYLPADPFAALIKDHPELISKHRGIIEHYYNKIKVFSIAILGNSEIKLEAGESSISDDACELIKSGVLPADAFHIATARKAGIDSFIAIDSDYKRIDGLTVYARNPNPSLGCKICSSAASSASPSKKT